MNKDFETLSLHRWYVCFLDENPTLIPLRNYCQIVVRAAVLAKVARGS